MTSLSAMSEGDEEEGGGDHHAREAADGSPAADEIREVQDEIHGVERKIEDVEKETEEVVKKINDVEAAIAGGSGYLGMTDPEALFREEEQLRRKEEQLRRKEEQLRRKEEPLRELLVFFKKEDRLSRIEQLRANNAPAGAVFQPANKNVTDFGAALTGAALTENTLTLANGTFFLGKSACRSKIFVRHCYNETFQLIRKSAAQRNDGTTPKIVIVGTPGIGKSVFGFFLLYQLRLEGRTVVFDREGSWYRFSDEGSVVGELSSLKTAGFFDDDNTWYLSDPKFRPEKFLNLPTVVFVSPKIGRTEEFLKMDMSEEFCMAPWGEDELMECRRLIFPEISEHEVQRRFDIVGGVARVVFGKVDFERYTQAMIDKAKRESVKSLPLLVANAGSDFSNQDWGDKLLHLKPWPPSCSVSNVKNVTFASDFAAEVVGHALDAQGTRILPAIMASGFQDENTKRLVTGSVRGQLFEHFAHKEIAGSTDGGGTDGRTFGMKIFGNNSTRTKSTFQFSEREAFKGTRIPGMLRPGVYYKPRNQNFPAIDGLGIDKGGDTLFFFQMKVADAEGVNGTYVETYWETALESKGPSPKNFVFLYVVPSGSLSVWEKATKEVKALGVLEGLSKKSKSACKVGVMETNA
ncbi:unnamed protein product [Pylaiella littoralis]